MIDINVVCLEGVVVREPMRMGGGEWGFRMSVDGREIRIHAGIFAMGSTRLHVGRRVWVAGHIEDVMVMRIVAEDIHEIVEVPPSSPEAAA